MQILNVNSLHLSLEAPLNASSSNLIPALPRGIKVRLYVSFRDHRGRLFNAANNFLKYRPHRFDLTDIVATDNNRTFDILLKQSGETVFRVWDSVNSHLSTFIRLIVADIAVPAKRDIIKTAEADTTKAVENGVTEVVKLVATKMAECDATKVSNNGMCLHICLLSIHLFGFRLSLSRDIWRRSGIDRHCLALFHFCSSFGDLWIPSLCWVSTWYSKNHG